MLTTTTPWAQMVYTVLPHVLLSRNIRRGDTYGGVLHD
jgi:hypothetical protein